MKTTCKFCGKEFSVDPNVIKKGKGKFCSLKCKGKAIGFITKYNHPRWKNSKKIKRTCKACGREFFVIPSLAKRGGKFCSKKCKIVFQVKENSSAWKGGKIKRNCKACHKEFYARISAVKSGGGKFCSMKCLHIFQAKENAPGWKGGKVKNNCLGCGKEFLVYPSNIKKGYGKFCSSKCAKMLHRGENHFRWKGGTSSPAEKIRHSGKYKEWRQRVFIRDDFTCQGCGQRGGDINAHHKKLFHKLLEETASALPLMDLYEAAMLYTPLWDINIGVTLCDKCHKKEQKTIITTEAENANTSKTKSR